MEEKKEEETDEDNEAMSKKNAKRVEVRKRS